MIFRCLVTGSREWTDGKAVWNALDEALADFAWQGGGDWLFVVVHGGCPTGADRHAHNWYVSRKVLWNDHAGEDANPADWKRLGKPAGNARNQVMVDKGAGLCLAFYQEGAANSGTADCVARAIKAGIPVRRNLYGKWTE